MPVQKGTTKRYLRKLYAFIAEVIQSVWRRGTGPQGLGLGETCTARLYPPVVTAPGTSILNSNTAWAEYTNDQTSQTVQFLRARTLTLNFDGQLHKTKLYHGCNYSFKLIESLSPMGPNISSTGPKILLYTANVFIEKQAREF